TDGVRQLGVLLKPFASPAVQFWNQVRLFLDQMSLQDVGKEVVVSVPLALIVQRDNEEVATFERLQDAPAAFVRGDHIAEGAAQPAENRGLQQEASDRGRLPFQNLLDQVIHN